MSHTTNPSILDAILEHKRSDELPRCKRSIPLNEMRRMAADNVAPVRDFRTALYRADGRVALIAEVKRASPSRGELVKGPFNPLELAETYQSNGAAAISVLTDAKFFKGSLDHLRQISQTLSVPVLRKDFIVDPYQLYEARAAGADAVLLIVAALDDPVLADLHRLSLELSLTPLVEVHNESETERALNIDAYLIGVNNRDLRTFATDINTTARCARLVLPAWQKNATLLDGADDRTRQRLIIAESGLFTAEDVSIVAAMGASAVLVGESIITSVDIALQVRSLASVARADLSATPIRAEYGTAGTAG